MQQSMIQPFKKEGDLVIPGYNTMDLEDTMLREIRQSQDKYC